MSAGVLSAQVIAGLATAGPPSYRTVSEGHREAPVRNAVLTKLDLQVPPAALFAHAASDSVSVAAPASPTVSASAPAYAGRPHDAARIDELASQPAWRGDAPRLRETTDIQDLAHGMRRNGLPLARLWQGRGALFSVGLSPKGKPGIWFIKQLP